jgi:hypothetical protein
MLGSGVLLVLSGAARLRPAFPTPALGPKRCVASPRLGFLPNRKSSREAQTAATGWRDEKYGLDIGVSRQLLN